MTQHHNFTQHPLADVMSPQDLANLGLNAVAYIRPVQTDQGGGYGVFAANGRIIQACRDISHARSSLYQEGLEEIHIQ